MRKLLIILVLVGFVAHGQQIKAGLGFDVANAAFGSKVNSKALDLEARVSYTNRVTDEGQRSVDEFGLYYERFERIEYESYGAFFNKVLMPESRFKLALGIEGSQIHRWKNEGYRQTGKHTYWWSYGANVEPRFQITERWEALIQLNWRWRPENKGGVGSTFLIFNYLF